MAAVLRTTASGKYLLLYDGHCRFCVARSRNLAALARRGTLHIVDFQEPGTLAPFPELSHEACMRAMHLITPDGRVYRGFEAAVQAVATRPVIGWFAYLYYIPGLRQLCDWTYRFVAAHRYRFFGRTTPPASCEGGTCSLHTPAIARDK
jgi:predicted DCC family thiol-disulfide oxidoreductase YuxK